MNRITILAMCLILFTACTGGPHNQVPVPAEPRPALTVSEPDENTVDPDQKWLADYMEVAFYEDHEESLKVFVIQHRHFLQDVNQTGVAVRRRAGADDDLLYFDASDMHAESDSRTPYVVARVGEIYRLETTLTPSYDGMQAQISDYNSVRFRMEIDFARRTAQWEHMISDQLELEERKPLAVSEDGLYEIVAALPVRGGEGFAGYWLIRNTVDGSLRYLCPYGHYTFGGQHVQFLNEDTIGVVFDHAVILYDTAANKLPFAMELQFGKAPPNEHCNVPVSLWASRNLDLFALLYIEKVPGIPWDFEAEEYTYRAALIDEQGRVLTDMETQIPIYQMFYTAYHPDIALDKEGILWIYSPLEDDVLNEIKLGRPDLHLLRKKHTGELTIEDLELALSCTFEEICTAYNMDIHSLPDGGMRIPGRPTSIPIASPPCAFFYTCMGTVLPEDYPGSLLIFGDDAIPFEGFFFDMELTQELLNQYEVWGSYFQFVYPEERYVVKVLELTTENLIAYLYFEPDYFAEFDEGEGYRLSIVQVIAKN